MNVRLLVVGLLAAIAGVLGALAFVPGAFDGLLPKRGQVSVGKALVGGPFTLTDHTGKRVQDTDYRGKLMVVYFGFTYCPDICPAGLQVVTAALDELGNDADKVVPLFITVIKFNRKNIATKPICFINRQRKYLIVSAIKITVYYRYLIVVFTQAYLSEMIT